MSSTNAKPLPAGDAAAVSTSVRLVGSNHGSSPDTTPPAQATTSAINSGWVRRITAAWRSSLNSILETGHMLTEAKAALSHGDFDRMIESGLPFGSRTAQRLMVIALDRRFSNPTKWGDIAQVVKHQHRTAREMELAANIAALPTQRYGVVLADPEWRFEPWSRATGMDRAADNHYPTSATELIATRPVQEIAADDCVLFLWATAPMLPNALLVMEKWGFVYRSQLVWAKHRSGTGYWFRNKHEILLVGVKGDLPAPAPGMQWDSLAWQGRRS